MTAGRYMKIKLGGIDIVDLWAAHLSSVSVTDSLDQLDAAQVVFDLPEGSGASLVKKLDIYGKTWSIQLIDDGSPVKEYSGDIIGISWTRSGGAPRQATVSCIDQLHRLKRGRKAAKVGDRRWRSKAISDIATAVAKDWDLGVSGIDSTSGMIGYLEWKGDDAALLNHLAETCGCVVRCDFESGKPGLVFAKSSSYASKSVTLNFGVEILDISANHNLDRIVTEVKGWAKDPSKPTELIQVKNKALEKTNSGKTGPDYMKVMGSFPHAIERGSGEAPAQTAMEETTTGIMIETASSFVGGSLTCRFDPNITSGKTVTVQGAGWPFDGEFVVKEVTHTFDSSGYRSQVTFNANSINAPS